MAEESLETIAQKLVERPKGILAIDESSGTIKKRFDAVGLEDTEENRRDYRHMLISASGLGQYISGAILFEETLYQKTFDGKPFVEILNEQGITPGIKVDKGLEDMANFPGERVTKGIDGLRERSETYGKQGAQFTKFRVVFSIGDEKRSIEYLYANVQRLAEYVSISQEQGLVPIVEPEVLIDGSHNIDRCFYMTEMVLNRVFDKLDRHKVYFKGMVLKPNMIVPGKDYKGEVTPSKVAEMTTRALLGSVSQEVPGIAFLSGGLSDEDATTYLNVMNQNYTDLPWNLTFSFGRGLQREPLKVFAQKDPNYIENAQQILLQRAKECSMATLGQYKS